jgi:hypothetical protein
MAVLQRVLQLEAEIGAEPAFGRGPASAGAPEPFGHVGAEPDRGPDGRFRPGNRAALVAGQHSAAFWRGVEAVRAEGRRALLAQRGHAEADAPLALVHAVDGAVQAVLLRDSAFLRIVESGGPTTLRGRRRVAFRIWTEASDRAERLLRLIGLDRVAKPIDPLVALHERVARDHAAAEAVRAARAGGETT